MKEEKLNEYMEQYKGLSKKKLFEKLKNTKRFLFNYRNICYNLFSFKLRTVSKKIKNNFTKENIKELANSVDGMITEVEQNFLIDIIKFIPKKGNIVEIGSYCGKSTILLGCAAKLYNKSNIISIDSHEIDYFYWIPLKELFLDNIKVTGIEDKVTLINKKSEEAAKEWNTPISLLFIDGDHSFEGVKKDYLNYKKYIVNGGFLLFHDYGIAEVKQFINSTNFEKDGFKKEGIVNNNLFYLKRVR